jgi:hypothetical protein
MWLFMKVDINNTAFDEEVSKNIAVGFTYVGKDEKKYNGTLHITQTAVGDMITETYEINWLEKQPKDYNPKTDDSKIYELYRELQ